MRNTKPLARLLITIAGLTVLLAATWTGSAAADETLRSAGVSEDLTTAAAVLDPTKLDSTIQQLAVPHDDGPVLADFTPTPAPTRSTRPSALTGNVFSSGAAVDGPGSYLGGEGCLIQCITSGLAYARGVDAELFVTTHVPASVILMVLGDDYARVIGSAGTGYSFSAMFDDLEAGTTYEVLAIAQDGQGYVSQAYGTFTTYTRHVAVTSLQASIISSPYGNDLMSWDLWAEGAWLTGGVHEPIGDHLIMGLSEFDLGTVDQHLDLAVQIQHFEDSGSCGSQVDEDSPPSAGEDACHTWATAYLGAGLADLDDRPPSATSWTEHTLDRTLTLPDDGGALPPGYGAPLDFTVPVTLHVTYLPVP